MTLYPRSGRRITKCGNPTFKLSGEGCHTVVQNSTCVRTRGCARYTDRAGVFVSRHRAEPTRKRFSKSKYKVIKDNVKDIHVDNCPLLVNEIFLVYVLYCRIFLLCAALFAAFPQLF